MVYLMNDEYEDEYDGPACDCENDWCAVCTCGKPECLFEDCPICGEPTCLDCDDVEAYHRDD